MNEINKILGVEILNIWIMRKGGIALFTKDYRNVFNYDDDKESNPMIMAVLDGFLNVFNNKMIGLKCDVMKFGDIIFSIYYATEPTEYRTLLISKLNKKNNIEEYLKILTETIGKVFGKCNQEILLSTELSLNTFKDFEDKIDFTITEFIKKLYKVYKKAI